MVTGHGKAECSGYQVKDSEHSSVHYRGIHYVLLVSQNQEAKISRLTLQYSETVGQLAGVWICLLTGSTDLRVELTFCAIHARV